MTMKPTTPPDTPRLILTAALHTRINGKVRRAYAVTTATKED